jgi:hypothetical protein
MPVYIAQNAKGILWVAAMKKEDVLAQPPSSFTCDWGEALRQAQLSCRDRTYLKSSPEGFRWSGYGGMAMAGVGHLDGLVLTKDLVRAIGKNKYGRVTITSYWDVWDVGGAVVRRL